MFVQLLWVHIFIYHTIFCITEPPLTALNNKLVTCWEDPNVFTDIWQSTAAYYYYLLLTTNTTNTTIATNTTVSTNTTNTTNS